MTTRTTCKAARDLEALYARAGMPCDIDAGPVGLVVYAATPAAAERAAESLANAPRSLGVPVTVEPAVFERDESAATAWVATVRFDWTRMPSSVIACVKALSPEAA